MCGHTTLIIHFPVDGCFQFGAISNKTAMKFRVQVFVGLYTLICPG